MSLEKYPPKLRELIEEFRAMQDIDLRTQLLIEYGERWSEVPETIASRPYPEQNKVPACESEAYLFPEQLPDGSLRFHFAIENPQGVSAKAMATIIDEVLSGEPLSSVAQIDEDVIYEFFGKNISMGKGLGLMGMVRMVRYAAERQKNSAAQ